MITSTMEDKFERLKCYFNKKFAEREENITTIFNNLLNNLIKEISEEIINEVNKQCKHRQSIK